MFDELNIDVLRTENGFNLLVEFLDLKLSKDDLADSLEKFEHFEDYRQEI